MDTDYFDYSELEVNDYFHQVLQYFFNHQRNPYKYPLAKKHYDDCKQSKSFTTTKRLFNIITGTNLVTTQMIMMYKDKEGTRYKIKKSYLQLVQRHQRSEHRHSRKTSQPYGILASETTTVADDDPSSNSTEDAKSSSLLSTPIVDNTETIPADVRTSTYDDNSIASDITKQADDITQNLDSALANIADEQQDVDTSSDVHIIVQRLLKSEIDVILKKLARKEELLDTKLADITALHSSCQKLEQRLLQNNDILQEKITLLQTQTTTWNNTIETFVTDTTEDLHRRFDDLNNRLNNFEKKSHSPTQDLDTKLQDLQSQLTNTHSHTKTRLHQLKTTTKALFKQNDDNADILSDRVFRLEDAVMKLKRKVHTPVKTKLTFDSSSDSDTPQLTPIYSSSTHNTNKQNTPTTPPTSSTPTSNRFVSRPSHTNPDMDYLRKNLHLTCSDTNQILEFYIKLRLAIRKGGIFLKPIEYITKDDSIADTTIILTTDDMLNQTNALYTLLANEKYIPSTFTMAQNCILGYSTSMDGFAALKAMLKLIHPVLNKKRPSNVPPILSDATDIHNYEQNLRNYYLLHKLYSKTEYSTLDQSKQFLIGIDDPQYMDAVKRIQHQLDTTEIMKIPVPDDFTLDNIASTILNIHTEYDNDMTVVRAFRPGPNHKQKTVTSNRQHRLHRTDSPMPRENKYSKTQCHACKQFGHIVTHCRLLPKVLAILQFKSTNDAQCQKVLKQHTTQNTISSKRTFVRALQMAHVLPDSDDSDCYLDDDIIVNSLNDNDIDIDTIVNEA